MKNLIKHNTIFMKLCQDFYQNHSVFNCQNQNLQDYNKRHNDLGIVGRGNSEEIEEEDGNHGIHPGNAKADSTLLQQPYC